MNERLPFLQQKTSRLTTSPGVYLMKNKSDTIIYVGKAKNLKNRVSSYFRNVSSHTPKVYRMVMNVYDYDFIVTDSEYEALILECSLIKQHSPKYNILLKDDKGYFYIKFSDELYPRVTAEKQTDNRGEFFGPYTSSFVATQTVREVNKVFKLPTCKGNFKNKNGRPCLNFHINQCIGLCCNKMSVEEYGEIINQAKSYIKNGNNYSIQDLKLKMQRASDALEFEKAARLRDRIRAIEKSSEKQKIFDEDLDSCDFIASSSGSHGICISLIKYRNGRLYDKLLFPLDSYACDEDLFENFISVYYNNMKEIPHQIVIEEKIENSDIIKSMLAEQCGHSVKLIFPQKGKLLKIVTLAKANAEEYLSLQHSRTAKEIAALSELSKAIGLAKPPEYIESYDISNFSSSTMVAGMVVFKDGRPLKKAYKRFSIKNNLVQNDYACMQEVIERRFNEYYNGNDEGFKTLPDLILLDGGKGHVNAVTEVLERMNINVPVFGLVKDDKHRTRAVATSGSEIVVSRQSPAFVLMTKIQDEVHRFAISYMKSKHTKNSYNYELTKVRGIGVKKAQKLMIEYKTLEMLKKATADELAKTAGVNINIAKDLYEYIQEM